MGFAILPTERFLVRVPTVATYTPEEIEILGLPVTYNRFGGYVEAYKELTTCMLPISKLIDIYIGNMPIYIVNREDIQRIHDILTTYIYNVNHSNNQYNQIGVKEERIEDIEKFAREMFSINTDILKPKKHKFDTDLDPTPRITNTAITEQLSNYIDNVNKYKPSQDSIKPLPDQIKPVKVSSAYDGLPNFDPTRLRKFT